MIKNLERSELREFSYRFRGAYAHGIEWTSQENPVTPKGYIVKPRGYMTRPGNASAAPFRCYGIVNADGPQNPFLDLQEAFEDLFSRVLYVGPRREDPRHDYHWGESHPKDVGRYGEKTISALLSSRVKVRSTDKQIDEQIMEWLKELDLIYSYTINSISDTEQDYELLVKQYEGGPEVGLTDVGFGVSQVLPLIAQCYCADEGSILIFENPEAHLHPKVQSELADVSLML